jgi:CheY-like chemotaxis protein
MISSIVTKRAHIRATPSLLDHEFRTPLNQIVGYAELMQEDAPDLATDLDKIRAAACKLLDLFVEHFGENRAGWNLPAPAVAAPQASTGIAAHAGRILVVDDDDSNRDMLSRRLARLGHGVSVAENGRRALEMLASESFDLMLLDLQMPELNGYQVLERLRADATLSEVPVIVLSASEDTTARRALHRDGCCRFPREAIRARVTARAHRCVS